MGLSMRRIYKKNFSFLDWKPGRAAKIITGRIRGVYEN
ncbi:hypothetical protein TRIP_B350219 [uncultured Desulfatiglans sp.]|nr:hypothetical protein TRIP_B350219 [uncultured Desulfatiglans sp.]